MLTPVDSGVTPYITSRQLCKYNIIPRATTEKAIQTDAFKSTIDKPK